MTVSTDHKPNPHSGETRAAYAVRIGHDPPPPDKAGEVWSVRPGGWTPPPLTEEERARRALLLDLELDGGQFTGAEQEELAALEKKVARWSQALGIRDMARVEAMARRASPPPDGLDLSALADALPDTALPWVVILPRDLPPRRAMVVSLHDPRPLLDAGGEFSEGDATYIVTACNAFPSLLAEVASLRALVGSAPELREALRKAEARELASEAEADELRAEVEMLKAITALPLSTELDELDRLVTAATPGGDPGHSQACPCAECKAAWARGAQVAEARAELPGKARRLLYALRRVRVHTASISTCIREARETWDRYPTTASHKAVTAALDAAVTAAGDPPTL